VKSVGIFEAKTRLSSLIEEVVGGETVVLTKRGVPVARIVPMNEEVPRKFGVARELFKSGAIVVNDDFDDPLPDELLGKLSGS